MEKKILTSWGDDENQSNNPVMNFKNPSFNNIRGVDEDEAYKEYIPNDDQRLCKELASSMADGIEAVRGKKL